MSNELSIKVVIANRTYPITVKVNEEEYIRKAAKLINERIKEYGANYSVNDYQDLLAMCALQFGNELLLLSQNPNFFSKDDNSIETKLLNINATLDNYLAELKEKQNIIEV